jgi:hypothetical protein
MRQTSTCSAVAVLLAAVCTPARAQTPLFSVDGTQEVQYYGSQIRTAGDVDADGRDDLLVVSSTPGVDSYTVQVLSGLDGSVLYEVGGAELDLGWAASGAGDANADGHADFAVTNSSAHPGPDQSGRVIVFSGADGSVLHDLTETGSGALFGFDIAPAGDIDGDGHDDLVIGAPYGIVDGGIWDAIVVHSGADGSRLGSYSEPYIHGGPIFGVGVAPAGDVDGDGTPDVMGMGWWHCEFADKAYTVVWSGATGQKLLYLEEPCTSNYLLASVGVGDVDLDGFGDIAIGKAGSFLGASGGQFSVHSGADGSVIHHVAYDGEEVEGDSLGAWIAAAGDVDHDGHPDILVGAPTRDNQPFWVNPEGPGYAQVFSGRDASVIATVTGTEEGDEFGSRVAAGDFDGDGFMDIAASAPRLDLGGLFWVGRVSAYSLYQPWRTIHGGVAGAAGVPGLTLTGTPQPSQLITATVDQGAPGALALLVAGLSLAGTPLHGGVLVPHVDAVVPLTLDASGGAATSARWPAELDGPDLLWFQAWVEDGTAPDGFAASDAVVGATPGTP